MDEVRRRALDAVCRDVTRELGIVLRVTAGEDGLAWVRGPGAGAIGLAPSDALVEDGGTADDVLVRVASDVQDHVVESLPGIGRPALWPACPEHPGTHPLDPRPSSVGTAVWACPRTGAPVARIGAL